MAKKNNVPNSTNFYVVGIGASACELEACKRFLKAIPDDSGMTFIIVPHLSNTQASKLPKLLSEVTNLPVKAITDDTQLLPNHIFIIPENKMLSVYDGTLKLSSRKADDKADMTIDFFVNSLEVDNEELLTNNQELTERQENLDETRSLLEIANRELMIQNEVFKQAEESCKQGSYSYNITNGNINFSDNFYRILGYEPGEFIPSFNEYSLLVHIDDRQYFHTETDKIIKEQKPSEWRYKMLNKNGENVYIKGTGRIINFGKEQILVGTLQDVTKDTLVNKHLQSREALLSESQKLGKTGSWEIDFVNNTITWSDEVYRMYGYEPNEIEIDMQTFGKLVPEDIPIFKQTIELSRNTGQPFEMEYRRYDKQKKIHYIYSKGSVRKDKNDNITGMLCISIDLTELREKESHLKLINEQLEHRNIELENINLELSSFSYAASHDLQEPLRKIQTFSKRLQEKYEELPTDVITYLTKIETSSERMSILVKDLLDYSRLNNPEKQFIDTDLNETLKNILNDFEVLIEQHKAIIKSSELPVIEAIPVQINQLFHNLISNSLKFTKENEIPIIQISSKTLSAKELLKYPKLNQHLTYVELIFKDNGIGFHPEYSKQIFTIFKRLHERTKYQGTGIGLSLSKKIAEIHNGCIFAESNEGEGAAFHIILPIKHS